MRRLITVIIIIIIVVSLILIGAWLISRNTAEKNGVAKLSFRQFLTGQSAAPNPPNTPDGNLDSVFVDGNITTPDTTTPNVTTPGTQVSTFTNSTTSPTQNTNTTNNGGLNTGTSTGTTPGTSTGTTTPPIVPASIPPVVVGVECSDADLNIRFTAEELAKLKALEKRFYAVSQYLHTDADVATETANHDNFKAKISKITEMYNYCLAKSPNITNPQYKVRVPTPFWNKPEQDSEVFLAGNGVLDAHVWGVVQQVLDDLANPLTYQTFVGTPTLVNNARLTYSEGGNGMNTRYQLLFTLRSLERSLRLNLW